MKELGQKIYMAGVIAALAVVVVLPLVLLVRGIEAIPGGGSTLLVLGFLPMVLILVGQSMRR